MATYRNLSELSHVRKLGNLYSAIIRDTRETGARHYTNALWTEDGRFQGPIIVAEQDERHTLITCPRGAILFSRNPNMYLPEDRMMDSYVAERITTDTLPPMDRHGTIIR